MKYGVFNRDDNEMFIMSQSEVFNYLQKETALFQNYGVETDEDSVVIYDASAPEHSLNGKIDVCEFFEGFEEDENILIRPIKEC